MAQSILKRARPLMLARLAAAALTFLIPAVLARALLPEAYGTFKQGWLVASTLQLVLPMGAPTSLYYFLPRHPERRRQYVTQTLLMSAVAGALAAALLLLAAPFIARHFDNRELGEQLPLVALFTLLLIAGGPLDAAFSADGRIRAAAVLRLVGEGSRALAMVVGALWTRSVLGVFIGIAAATGFRALLAWVLLVRAHGFGVSRDTWKRQLVYVIPFGVAFIAAIPQQQFHQYAVAASVTAAGFAVYSVGCFQLPIIDILYTPVSEILQIGLAEHERRGDHRAGLALFHEAVARLAFAFVPAMALLFATAPQVIELIFTARYLDAVPLFRVSLLQIALSALPLDGVMRARAQNRFMLGTSFAKLALTIPFVLGGLALWGPIGALGGWLTAEAAGRFALLVRSARLFGAPVKRALPWRELGKIALATLVAWPLAWLPLLATSAPLLVRLAASGTAFGLAYLGFLWLRGDLPHDWLPLRRGGAAPEATATSPAPAARATSAAAR